MIVLDTSFLVAFHNSRDVHHGAAARLMTEVVDGRFGPALLPEYVFLELVTVLAARRDLATAIHAGDVLLGAREVEFVARSDLFEETLAVFRGQRPSAGLSFADAAIVAVARARGARHVASFDRGFTRVDGITLVPAPEPIEG
jgi:predicted nucleic acid-binding protein